MAKDRGRAAQWFRKGAEADHPPSQHALAECYARGHGVAQDQAAAAAWRKKAADNGWPQAVRALGLECLMRRPSPQPEP